MNSQKISQIQIICIGVCNLMGTILVSVFVSAVLRHEAWLSGILGFIVFLPTMLIYFALTKKYPGKGLFQMNDAVFGPVAGRIISMLYILFFFSLCALNVLEATNFLSYFILPDASRIVIAALLVAACVYCVKTGIFPIARVSTIFLAIMCSVLLFYGLVTLLDAEFEYLLPLFSHKPLDYIQSAHIAGAIPFGETVSLLVLIPDLDKKVNIKKAYFAIVGLTAAVMVFVHVREIIALGPLIEFSALPTYEAARIVHISGFLARIESLLAFALIMLTLFKTIVLFYICTAGIKQVARLKSRRHINIMLGLLLTVYAVTTYGPPSSNIFFGKNVSSFLWTFYSMILPLLTLLAALVRTLLSRIRNRQSAGKVSQ